MIQRQNHPTSNIIRIDAPAQDTRWLAYFDPFAALESVINHVETLPGSRHERHTMRAYLASLADYCQHHGAIISHHGAESYDFRFDRMTQPTKSTTQDYIASAKRRGLTSATITRYMASIRHFLRALEEQSVIPRSGDDFVYIMEAQRQFRLAGSVKNPAPDKTSNRPALENHGKRLNLHQVNKLFSSFEHGSVDLPDIRTITGKRDLALLYLGITSGLRAAELSRLTLANIHATDNCFEIKVRGKRSNHDPIGIDDTAHKLIMDYVQSYNAALPAADPRSIAEDTVLFQPLLRGDHPVTIGLRGKSSTSGLSARAILKIVSRRSIHALGFEITAHDMRRTCAYLMRSHGYEWDQIRAQLRHRSIGTTEKYVGKAQDLSASLLSKRVHFDLPADNKLI